jgi:mRNA-degrading endonuclease RelE of RelBE toxin-antitoxin system
MPYEIILAPEAAADLSRLPARLRANASDALDVHLRHEPTKTSRSRIMRLRGLSKPQYRLRVDTLRIFYDVIGDRVEVLTVVDKAQAAAWLDREGRTT